MSGIADINVDCVDDIDNLSSISGGSSSRRTGKKLLLLATKTHQQFVYKRLLKMKTVIYRSEIEDLLGKIQEDLKGFVRTEWTNYEYKKSICKLFELLKNPAEFENSTNPDFNESEHVIWAKIVSLEHQLQLEDIGYSGNPDYIRSSAKWLYLATEKFLEKTCKDKFLE